MGETSTSARKDTLKVTSAVGVEPLIPEEGIFHFPADSTTIVDNVSHLCFTRSVPAEEQGLAMKQAKLEKLLMQVGLAAPGKSLASLMEELKAGAPGAVGLSKTGYILRIRLYIHPRVKQVWLIIVSVQLSTSRLEAVHDHSLIINSSQRNVSGDTSLGQ